MQGSIRSGGSAGRRVAVAGARGLRGALLWCVVWLGGLGAMGCSTGTGTPAGAVRALSRAAQRGDRQAVWALLGPQTQRRFETEAIRAVPLAGRRGVQPIDLVAVGWLPPRLHLVDVVERTREGERATVEVRGARGERETLDCVRVGRDWRVEVPGLGALPE
jgi:hypothetical protein